MPACRTFLLPRLLTHVRGPQVARLLEQQQALEAANQAAQAECRASKAREQALASRHADLSDAARKVEQAVEEAQSLHERLVSQMEDRNSGSTLSALRRQVSRVVSGLEVCPSE